MTARLNWRRTWPDTADDYCASDPETQRHVGRLYSSASGPTENKWRWFLNGSIGNRSLSENGAADTKQNAADEMTAAYFAAKDRLAGGNPYLKARGE